MFLKDLIPYAKLDTFKEELLKQRNFANVGLFTWIVGMLLMCIIFMSLMIVKVASTAEYYQNQTAALRTRNIQSYNPTSSDTVLPTVVQIDGQEVQLRTELPATHALQPRTRPLRTPNHIKVNDGLEEMRAQAHLQQQQQLQQTASPHDQNTIGNQTEIEIADKYKNIWMDKTNLKNCVSITPISPDSNSRGATQQQGVDVKRSVGIEIIPLTAANGANASGASITLPGGTNVPQTGVNTSSTITITPINAVTNTNINTNKDKKSSGVTAVGSAGLNTGPNMSTVSGKRPLDVTSTNDTQKEKKRKKKRDDSPMGPPEKVYSRQNSPAATNETAATVAARKFSSPSSSPKGGSGSSMLSGANTGAAGNAALLSTRPSPKHSPVYSSPKHSNTASNSPKSPFGTHSPKHGSSGKPSMSTLKSATATSLSPKGDKSGCGAASSLVGNAAAGVAAANAVKAAMGVGVVGGMQQMKSINHLAAPTALNTSAGGYSGVNNMSGGGAGGVSGGVGQLLSGNGAPGGMDMNAAAVAASQVAAMRKVVSGAVSSYNFQ
uniref:Mediator of RNA polymerase II transcription subunit 1 n=1 Tax=Bactrocera dorsalis TaxID=27457 RepID=A0A034VDM9_BACDO